MMPSPADLVLALSRSVELSLLAKVTLTLALGLAVARLVSRAPASVRHRLLAATFGALLALPLVVIGAPQASFDLVLSPPAALSPARAADRSPGAATRTTDARDSDGVAASRTWPAISGPAALRAAWIGGAFLLSLPLLVTLWRLRRVRGQGLPWPELREEVQSLAAEAGIRRRIEVVQHEEVPAPVTYGLWRPVIVLPADARQWSEADLRQALVHELEHVQRGDWAVQLGARAVCAVYWFHPLVWAAWRRLGLEAERACDDAVVARADGTAYAEQLVRLARRLSVAPARATLGMANRSDLSRRVSAVLDDKQRRGRAGRWTAVGALSLAGLFVLGIAPVRAVARPAMTNAAATASHETEAPGKRAHVSAALDRALFEACENGDLAAVDELLEAGANVNAALDGDGSPLIAAAREGRLAVVQRLIDRGADPNMAVAGDGSPLIMAAGSGRLNVVSLLLDRGAEANMAVPGDGSPLIAAAREGHANVTVLLLDRGANVDMVVPEDENALIQASGSGHLGVVKLLVDHGANVNARVQAEGSLLEGQVEWRTPLSMARKGGHQAVVDFLIAAGARE